jgi:hypothetical protein
MNRTGRARVHGLAASSIIAVSALWSAGAAASAPDDASVDQAIDRALGDHSRYQAVFIALKQAVADHDAAKVAELIDYPLRVTIGGKKSRVRSAKDFLARYPQIMTPAIQKVVIEQRYADLFVNSSGVMFGNGQVWLRGICKDPQCQRVDVKIGTIQSTSNLDDQNAH